MPHYYELISKPQDGQVRFNYRQELLRRIEKKTGRPVIVYAANMNVANIPNSLDHSDITPFPILREPYRGTRWMWYCTVPGDKRRLLRELLPSFALDSSLFVS